MVTSVTTPENGALLSPLEDLLDVLDLVPVGSAHITMRETDGGTRCNSSLTAYPMRGRFARTRSSAVAASVVTSARSAFTGSALRSAHRLGPTARVRPWTRVPGRIGVITRMIEAGADT